MLMMEDYANDFYEKGYSLVPLIKGTKRPFMDNWPEIELVPEELKRYFQTGYNIGIKTGKPSGMVAIDIDEKLAAREFYKKHSSMLKTIVETRKGAHFWFRYSEVGNGKHSTGDIRGDGGQVVVPNSEVGGWKYKFVKGHGLVLPEELPEFSFDLIEGVTQQIELKRKKVKYVEKYLSKIESIEGQYGSKGLMRAIYVCLDAGLTEAETMLRLIRWNETNAKPQWNDTELLRGVQNALKARGYENHENEIFERQEETDRHAEVSGGG